MKEIIGVRFKKIGKIYYFDPDGTAVPAGTSVIVETSRGVEMGECVLPNTGVPEKKIVEPLRPLLRIATEEDFKKVTENQALAKKAMEICRTRVAAHKLDMKIVDTEYTFDGGKLLFYFTADGRIDFRELVKNLASVFRTRVELRQIGVRDEAKMLGGLGVCGKPFCCSTFLDEFQPVSVKMAKEQGLSLNPTKISGTCGRLMCCLKYEQESYEHLLKTTPRVDSLVETPMGPGSVYDVSLLRGTLKIRLDKSPDAAPVPFNKSEVRVTKAAVKRSKNGGASSESKKSEKTAPPAEEKK